MTHVPDFSEELPTSPELTEREKQMFTRGLEMALSHVRRNAERLEPGALAHSAFRDLGEQLDLLVRASKGTPL